MDTISVQQGNSGNLQPDSLDGLVGDAGQLHNMREGDIASVGGETILVAEDEELVRLFLEKALLRRGYRVITAEDGEQAIAAFREHGDSIDLVISDMVMPKKTGKDLYDVISRLKAGIRVIFITGYSPDMIDLTGMPEEKVYFIPKPFSKNDLLVKIRELLAGENRP